MIDIMSLSIGRHRTHWTSNRFAEDLICAAAVASGKRVDLTKRAWRK